MRLRKYASWSSLLTPSVALVKTQDLPPLKKISSSFGATSIGALWKDMLRLSPPPRSTQYTCSSSLCSRKMPISGTQRGQPLG